MKSKKIRYSISFVALLAMITWSLPQLGIQAGGTQQVFAISWLLFALVAVGANLQGMLKPTTTSVAQQSVQRKQTPVRKRMMG